MADAPLPTKLNTSNTKTVYESESLALVTNFDLQTAVLVEFSSRDINCNAIEKISYKGSDHEGRPIRRWGSDNNLPFYREQVVSDNNIVPSLLQTKRDINYGTGLFAYKLEEVSDGGKINIKEVPMPPEAKEFFEQNDIEEYLLAAFKSLAFHANIFTEMIRETGSDKITHIGIKECKYVRLGEQNDQGVVDKAYISGNWATGAHTKDGVTESDRKVHLLPIYNKKEDEGQQKHFILHTGDTFLNDGYYNSPTWWSSRAWIELANAIPEFHQANIRNGYTIRFHIKVPKGYFYTAPTSDADDALKKAKEQAVTKKEGFMKMVNDVLAGAKNAGRALFTEFDLQQAVGSQYPGITIEPINVDIKDKALLELYDKSNTANISAQGIHPTLANIETQGRLSSGSEIRNAFIMYLAIKTPIPRMIVLKAINLVKKINKWPKDVFFGFGDTEITTLDESPTGMKEDAVVVPSKGEDEEKA